MAEPIKILLLEDNPDDAHLILRTLTRAGIELISQVVDDRVKFTEALRNFQPDAILSDHQLPQFISSEALEISRNIMPYVPFILVTGAVSEEFAASIINAGADDYLLKGNLKRLPTALGQALEKLRTKRLYDKAEANLHSIIDNSDTAFVLIDLDLNIQYFNELFEQQCKELLGIPPTAGASILDVIGIERKTMWLEALKTITRGAPFEIDIEIRGKEIKWFHYLSNPVRNEKQEITGIMTAIRNITERKKAQLELEQTSRELSDLIYNANTPIFGTDSNGLINEWNRYTESLTGYSKNDVFGQNLFFIKESDRNKFIFILGNVEGDQFISNLEIPIITKDNRELVILLNITPRKHSASSGFLMVGQNITEMTNYRSDLEAMVEKRTYELNEALKKEKELVDLKSRFVSVASHEFRTPLSTISFAAESIRKYFHQLSAEEINRKLIKIEDQVSHMTNLLEDILTVGKSEAGKIKVKRISIDLKSFVVGLIEEVNATAKTRRKIELQYLTKFEKVSLDDKLLRNILVNLFTNAIKFSAPITEVHVSISDYAEGIRLKVTDFGIGIQPEELNTVFEAFQRGSNVSNIQGTGLGLSITRKAVDLMNGTIRVESTVGQGTTFIVEIPVP